MKSIHRYMFVLLAGLLWPAGAQAADLESVDYIRRDFVVDAVVVSYVPGEGIEGYGPQSSGMAGVGGTFGIYLGIGEVFGRIDVTPRLDEGRFFVTVGLEEDGDKRTLDFENKDLDLTDLKPVAILLGTSKKGRVHQLNLTPSVRVTDNTPKPLDVSKFRYHNWQFPGSPILVDDALYVGRIACAESPVAWLDISGVASVEFSLYQLTDSKPWGVLSNGSLILTHPDGQTIQISNVSNGGPHAVALPGGPYRVWVRWSDPTYTVQQHRESLIKIRERILNGEFPNARTDRLDKQLARDPSPWIISSGIRGLKKGEWVNEAD